MPNNQNNKISLLRLGKEPLPASPSNRSTIYQVSQFCLKLLSSTNSDSFSSKTNSIYPLKIGKTSIGHSELNDICIKEINISDTHAIIKLFNRDDFFDGLPVCQIRVFDENLNTLQFNDLDFHPIQLSVSYDDGDLFRDIHLNDIIKFDTIKFILMRITDAEKTEQEPKSQIINLCQTTSDYMDGKYN